MKALGALSQLCEAAGPMWVAAIAVAFFTMMCESAGPVVEPGEEKAKPGPLRLTSLIFSLFTPILLFVHAYWAVALLEQAGPPDGPLALVLLALRSLTLVALYVLMLALILAPGALAALLRTLSKPLARALYAAAPMLTIASFAFAVFATQRNVASAIDLITYRLSPP